MSSFFWLVLLLNLSLALSRLMFHELNMTTSHAQYFSKLMDNQHIVMVGDSLMRYQYLSLVYLIHTTSFYPDGSKPSILWEKDYVSWIQFFNASNAVFSPNEYCECYRINIHEQCENRYYFHKERNISISYIGYMGEGYGPKVHGWWSPRSNETNHQFHPPNKTFVPFKWEANSIQEALFDHIAKLKPKPSVLLMNAGIWPNNYHVEDHRNSVLNLSVSLFERVIWKTTNYDRNHLGRPSFDICQRPGIECLNIDWTQHLQPGEYVDLYHFQSYIYMDINIQFILQLTNRNNATMIYAPMHTSLHDTVVRYQDKHYLVDGKGLLRPFVLPTKDNGNATCIKQLGSRVVVERSASFLRKHIVGEAIADICTF